MAIVRCDIHPVERNLAKHTYEKRAKPLGYPTTAAICGRVGCKEPGLVWLTHEEVEQFNGKQRYFGVHTQTIKIRVSDQLLPLP
jgi:hypothetical protein